MGEGGTGARLSERPDWRYLMQEVLQLYQRGKAGGSTVIRAHQRAVREAVGRLLDADPPLLARVPETKAVTAHLGRALDNGRAGPLASLVRAVDAVRGELAWLHGYEKVPRGLARKYAYAEIAGPSGPVASGEVILGLVLFAPACTYPAHAHQGLTESYYTVSGAVSENDAGVWAPGSLILNPPGRMHRITTGDAEPALLAYAWHGAPEVLAGQKMVFARAGRKPEA